MVVLAVVAVACFIAGMWAATRWLPPLASEPVGTLVYFVVCGLAGGVLATVGVVLWQIVDELGSDHGRLLSDSQIVAPRIIDLFWYPGGLAALGLIAYLLAPKAQPRESS